MQAEQNPPTPGMPRKEDYTCNRCKLPIECTDEWVKPYHGMFRCVECGSHTFNKRRSELIKRLVAR
jgi:DNA-directed RNA polymerase subunit RPC12/RpoP